MEKFFSICIPQYNRWPYLLESLKVLKEQTFQDFEVCISDDCSTEQGKEEIIQYLESNSISYRFHQQNVNTGYDKNLRTTIGLATGKYIFLLGNDDCLAKTSTLQEVHSLLIEKMPSVLKTKKILWGENNKAEHIINLYLGSGKKVAVKTFFRVTFISGVIIDRKLAQKYASDKWDGTTNYHVFLVPKIVSEGNTFMETNLTTIKYDVQIKKKDARLHLGEFITKKNKWPWMITFGQRMVDTIFSEEERASNTYSEPIGEIFLHLYVFAFPFHIHQFKTTVGVFYATKMWWEFRPKRVIKNTTLCLKHVILIYIFYIFSFLSVLMNDAVWNKLIRTKGMLRKILNYKN